MADKNIADESLQVLKSDLREKTPRRLYVFFGEEQFLLNHYLGMLKKLLVDPLTESFNFHRFTSENFDMQSFADSVENLPMMAESTMVQVDDVDLFKQDESGRTRLCEIFADIPPYCTVVLTYNTVEWKLDKRYAKLCEAVNHFAFPVQFPKQSQRDLISWITRHFSARQKKIAPELCAYLIEITDGTMTSLAGEISKISAYSGADTITRSDIDAVVEPVLDAVVFDMTNLLGSGKYGEALVSLQKLLKMQEEPIMLLGAIGGHFRNIAAARTLLDNGKGVSDLMKLRGMRDFAARKTIDCAKLFSRESCRKAMELILETDYAMKTSFDDKKRLLEMLILQLGQVSAND